MDDPRIGSQPRRTSAKSAAKSQAFRIKQELHQEILRIAETRAYTRRDLERILEQPQPRISELMCGKISGVSIEKLLHYLHKLGASPKIAIEDREVE